MSPVSASPPSWTREQFEAEKAVAAAVFIAEREGQGPEAFDICVEEARREIGAALEATDALRNLAPAVFESFPSLWQTLRYFCAPPISEEDLWSVVGRKFSTVNAERAPLVGAAFERLFDRRRFGWLRDRREPSTADLEAAVGATTLLLAHERFKTSRRRNASKSQEDIVAETLSVAGWTLDASRSAIVDLDMLPRGSFSRERKVDGAKCDIPIRLGDGRLLAVECKVSNGPKNSWKRLCREVGGKAERWNKEFGTRVVTGAVIAGNFDTKNLLDAQNEQAVAIFWQHDLTPLVDFLRRTR